MTKNYRHQHSAGKQRIHQSIFNGKKQLLYMSMCLGRLCPVRDLRFPPPPHPLPAVSSIQCAKAVSPPDTPQNNSKHHILSHRIIFPALLQGQQQELSAPKPSPFLQQPGKIIMAGRYGRVTV